MGAAARMIIDADDFAEIVLRHIKEIRDREADLVLQGTEDFAAYQHGIGVVQTCDKLTAFIRETARKNSTNGA